MIGSDWIEATRRNLLGGFTETRNVLNVAYNPGDGQLTMKYPLGAINVGSIISAGLNVFYVLSISGEVVTVLAGQNGASDVAVANGTLVRVNPKFTDWEIWQALTNDLQDLSSPTNGLFGINSTSWTYSTTTTGYDLGTTAATNLLSVYEVRHLTPGPEKDNPRLPSWAYYVNRQAYTVDIPSGVTLQLTNPMNMMQGFKFWAVWKSLLVMPANPTADVSTSLLQTSAYDLPPLGAAIALMAGREIKRNFTESQGEARRATEVPPGAVAASANGLKYQRQARISSEATRLMQMYPVTKD